MVRMRKKHPCGSYEWQVLKLGADVRIKCRGCGRCVLLEHRSFERRIKSVISQQAERKERVVSR